MDFNDYDREEIMDLAIDIIDNTDATLEEAVGRAMETAYDRNQMMDVAGYVYNRDIADMAIEASMIDNINNEHENYGSIEDKVDYSKLMPGYQRATAKKLSKMIDEYVAMQWVDDKAKLGNKIVRILSTPVIKEFLVKSGYWDQIPTSIKQLGKRDAQLYKALNDTAWSASAKLLTDKKFRSQLKRGIKNAITHKKKQTAKKATESAYASFKDDDERKKCEERINKMLKNGAVYRPPTSTELQKVLSALRRERAKILSDPEVIKHLNKYRHSHPRVNTEFDKNMAVIDGRYINVINSDRRFCSEFEYIIHRLITTLKQDYPEFANFIFEFGKGNAGCIYVNYVRVQSLSELSKSDIEKLIYRARLLPDDPNHITLKDFVRVGSETRKFLIDQRNKKQNDAISEYWK